MLEVHQKLLELVADGAPHRLALERLVLMVEDESAHGARAAILLVDEHGNVLRFRAAPTIPSSYTDAVDAIPIELDRTSCGRAAALRRQVVVEDIARDPLFAEVRELALAHGLRACCSTPILSRGGRLLGTLALYYDRPTVPPPSDLELVRVAVRSAAAILAWHRLERERDAAVERERAARVEAERRAEAVTALEVIGEGVCLLDGEGAIRLWNPAAERMLGKRAVEVIGHDASEVFTRLDISEPRSAAPRVRRTVPVGRDRQERWISISRTDFVGGVVYVFDDVTEEHRLEQLRAEVIATVSHELRTPLTAVYGTAKTLARMSSLDERHVPALLEMIGSEAERLRTLVDRILVAEQIEHRDRGAGAADPFDGCALVRSLAAVAGGSLRVVLPAEPVFVAADLEQTRQVLESLLENAAKYSGPEGSVELGLSQQNGRARFSVADRGPGIPASARGRVFEKFFRVDPEMTRGVGGMGLGLYIARGLAEHMGGRVSVESEEGEGSTFVLELPSGSR